MQNELRQTACNLEVTPKGICAHAVVEVYKEDIIWTVLHIAAETELAGVSS